MVVDKIPAYIQEIARRPGGRRLMDIPELPGQMLRRMRVGTVAAELSLSPTRYMNIVDEHFSHLREHCGLPMPEFTYYFDKRTTNVYALTDIILGESLEMQTPSYLKAPHIQPFTPEMAEAYSDYTDWFSRRFRKFYLYDTIGVRQTMLGHNPRHEAGQRLYMVDGDPYLERLDTQDLTWDHWQEGLAKWTAAAQS